MHSYRALGPINYSGHIDHFDNLCSLHLTANRTIYQNHKVFIYEYIHLPIFTHVGPICLDDVINIYSQHKVCCAPMTLTWDILYNK